jgi:ribosomal protein S18 acetylase RimI-like enzyme
VSTFVIHEAVRADAAAIAGVHVRAWRAAYRGLMPDDVLDALSPEARRAQWDEGLALPVPRPTLVATDAAGTIAGFCALAEPTTDDGESPRSAEITALYVDPSRWRAGVGSVLLAAARDRLRAREFEQVILWVLVGNVSARAFYEHHGFEADGGLVEHEPPGAHAPSGLRAERMRARLG